MQKIEDKALSKKKIFSYTPIMRILSTLVTLAALGYGAYWVNENRPELKTELMEIVHSGDFHTLEARYTAQQIMDMHKSSLLKSDQHKFLTPKTQFSPYLLMEVKYTKGGNATGEGVILWDLLDGEMVINSNHWEKTHGYCDCIRNNIDGNEFKVINALALHGGTLDRESLVRVLQVENDVLGRWLNTCRKKKLIVQSGSFYRLHLQTPKLALKPETLIDDRIVTKSYKSTERMGKKFSHNQIRKIAEASFGQDFAVRHTLDVYLPIYSITVENPDGSHHTSYWNAINGYELQFTSLLD
jgi:hypothetical protein